MKGDRRRALYWSYFFLVLFAIFFLTPPIYMMITSLKSSAEIGAITNPWFVYAPTLDNYTALLGSEQYLTFFKNSAIVSLVVVVITMLISIPAAFALARMKFWGSAALGMGVFLTYLIPETLLFIPVALPGIIAATIFAFTVSWADFLYPMAFTTSADQLVLPAGIVTILIRGDVYEWGQIMAACLLGALPPLLIYAFLMDYYIAGLTAGATKG